MQLSKEHKRYLTIELGVGAAIVNAVLNAGLGWLMLRGRDGLPLTGDFGEPAISGELLGVCLFLPFLTGLIVTPLVRREVRRGRVPALSWPRADRGLLGKLPRGTFARSLLVGVICVILVAVPIAVVLSAIGLQWLDFGEYLIAKAAFCGLLAAPVTPWLGIYALADDGQRQET